MESGVCENSARSSIQDRRVRHAGVRYAGAMVPVMRSMLHAMLLGFALTLLAASGQDTANDGRARELIRQLNLHVLPKESGYIGIIGTSSQRVSVDGRVLAVQSQNYYMLTRERPINYLHWLAPDDTHVLIDGGPVDYFVFCPGGRAEKFTLGMDLQHGERPVVAVPGGCWKALRLRDDANYALMANALSPEFTTDRVRIGAGQAWIDVYKQKAPWATEVFLRGLIGPNWVADDATR